MCTCTSPAVDDQLLTEGPRLSVQEHWIYEAERFKWIESEKAGRDLGESAIQNWVRQHWNGFLRARWLEHLEGKRYWIELDHHDFGLLNQAFRDSSLMDEIVRRLKNGEENLNILWWASRNQLVDQRAVFDILLLLDMNSRRIECQLEQRLSQQR